MTDLRPLPLDDDHWRSRWLVFPSWNRLHRVVSIDWDDCDGEDPVMISGPGTILCGRTGYLQMPGIFGRMGLERCRVCCRRAGVPEGAGAPYNQGIEEAP